MTNAFSIDLEEWFCVYNLSKKIPKDKWDIQESRIESSTDKLLELLKRFDTKATFFVLGWVAERHPDLIRKIDDYGHEIASHGYAHNLLTETSEKEFETEMLKSLEILSKCTKQNIVGFRAPSFTITQKTLWGLEVLKKLGFKYDSSVFPVGFHPEYGIKNASLEIFEIIEDFIEVPMSCAVIGGKRIPCSGGGYFRLFPYNLTRFLINKCNNQGRPVIFYLHPWEIDAEQPRINLGLVKKFRHYNNLNKTFHRLEKLLNDFKFTNISKVIEDVSKY